MNRNSRGSVWGSYRQPPARIKALFEAGDGREGGTMEDFGTTCPHTPRAPGRAQGLGQSRQERRKPPYPCSVLDLVDPQLHGHVKAVQDVSAKYQRVYRGVDSMDPTWGGEGTGRVSRGLPDPWGGSPMEARTRAQEAQGKQPGPQLRIPGLPDPEGTVPGWPTGLGHTAPKDHHRH